MAIFPLNDPCPCGSRACIDPEDREQVERLVGIRHPSYTGSAEVDRMQDALREFADPKPPKPEESTGLGAVVEDAKGELWILRDTPSDAPWINAKGNCFPVRWPSVDAVRILSHGYDPEATS